MKCNILLVIVSVIQSVIFAAASVAVETNDEFDKKNPNMLFSSLYGDIYTRRIRDTATASVLTDAVQTDDRQSVESYMVTNVSKGRRKKSLRDLFFGVLLPSNLPDRRGSRIVLPAIELAVSKVQAPGGLLEGFNITMEYRDTMCSSVYGPLAAFELYTKRKPGQYFKIFTFIVLSKKCKTN